MIVKWWWGKRRGRREGARSWLVWEEGEERKKSQTEEKGKEGRG